MTLTASAATAGGLDWHDAATDGVAVASVRSLLRSLKHTDEADVYRALGITQRTLQRRSGGTLDANASDRALRLMAVAAQATDVLGTREAAELWLSAPAIGLEGRRPIDLLQTSAGTELVRTLLTRMDFGVYA